ncbi:Endothelial differentiation- factor 1 [Phlyctochytrium planicorne]|nr:Endothelial differentiation- factor 1 [Phlyctochytrium planicorne]
MGDWDDVTVIRKRAQNASDLKSTSAVNAARRAGGSVSTEKKTVANNNGPAYDAGKAAKLDRETEDFKIERVGMSVGKAIQQARAAKQLTQKDLATKINEKQTVVNEYESGKAANPNQQVLAKMERVLGVKLRGQNIGSPLGGK